MVASQRFEKQVENLKDTVLYSRTFPPNREAAPIEVTQSDIA